VDGRRTAGFNLAEILIATAIMSAVAIPVFGLLIQERRTAHKAHQHYLCMLGVREEMMDIRFLLAAGVPMNELAHDWQPLSGKSFKRLEKVIAGPAPDVEYQPEQAQIQTKVMADPAVGRIELPTISVRYDPPGPAGSAPGGSAGAPGAGRGQITIEFPFGAPRPRRSGDCK
jgi:hypothetical protein